MNNSTTCVVFGLDLSQESRLITYKEDLLIVCAALLSLVAAFTVVSNLVVIIALVRPRYMERTITTSLVTSMACSDAVLGAFIMPLGIYEILNNGHWDIGIEMCNVRVVLDVVLSTVSIFHVTNMAIERYLAVCKPWVYLTLSMKTTYVMLGLSWFVPPSVVALPVLGNWHTIGIEDQTSCLRQNDTVSLCVLLVNIPFQLFMTSMSFYGPMVIIIIIYSLIFREARASEKYHSTSTVTLSGVPNPHRKYSYDLQKDTTRENSKDNISSISSPGPSENHSTQQMAFDFQGTKMKKSKNKRKNVKTAKAIGSLILCFAMCWMPFSIWVVVAPFVSFSTSLTVHLIVMWLGYLNSAINPVLYCSHKTIKSAIWSLLCPKSELERRRRQARAEYSTQQLTTIGS